MQNTESGRVLKYWELMRGAISSENYIAAIPVVQGITEDVISPIIKSNVNSNKIIYTHPEQVIASAKSVTKISNKSVTLTVGKTKTISLKNYKKLSKKAIKKVKWTTSNKKVVSIKVSGKYKQKCKLTAKKAGTSTIKVKYNGKTYKCKVTVKKKATNTTSNNNNNSNDTTSNTDKTPTTPVQPTTPTTPNTPEVPTTPTAPTAPTTPVDNNTNDIVEHDCKVYYDYANPIERDNKIYYVCTICGKEYCEGEVEEFLSYIVIVSPDVEFCV